MAQIIELLNLETCLDALLNADWEQIKTTSIDREPLPALMQKEHSPPFVEYPGVPFALGFPLRLNEERVVYAFADSLGKGYTSRSRSIRVLHDAAESRLQAMTALEKKFKKRGIDTEEMTAYLQAAQYHWDQANLTLEPNDQNQHLFASLQESIGAGESLALQIATFRTKRNGWRDAFFWGCSLGSEDQKALLNAPLLPVVNCLSLDFSGSQSPDFEPAVRWAQQNRVSLKAASILTPQALKSGDPAEWQQRLIQTMDRYRGAIRYWEILTNPHWAILDSARLVSLARDLGQTARNLDPQCARIISVSYDLTQPNPSAIPYLSELVEHDAPFECVGLMLTGGSQDYFELDETLERYADFGKPIHLSLRLPPASTTALENTQADWLEAAVSLAYSKPYLVSVTVETPLDSKQDQTKCGLFNSDLAPKPSFLRLSDMKALWRAG